MTPFLLAMPCWVLFLLIVALAWPIWHHAHEFAMFQRRAVLDGVALEHSAIRRRLWAGRVAGVAQGVLALLWALVLLTASSLLAPAHWLLLGLDALLLAALAPLVRRRLASQVRPMHVAMVARRWPLLLGNVAVLAIAFFVLDFFVLGAHDTRGLAWSDVAQQAFAAHAGQSRCALAGMVLGLAHAANALTWHAAQVLIPGLPRADVKLLAWLAMLLQAGVVAWAFTRFVLGCGAWIESALGRDTARRQDGWPFLIAVLLFAAPLALLADALREPRSRAMPEAVGGVIAWANPCRTQGNLVRSAQPALHEALARSHASVAADADRRVNEAVSAAFAGVEKRVDDYLDWYFSVPGQYERLLAALGAEALAANAQEAFERRVVRALGLPDALDEASRRIAGESAEAFAGIASALGGTLRARMIESRCLAEFVDPVALRALDRDVFRASIAAGSGALAAVGTRAVASRVAGGLAARLAARQGTRAAATAASALGARRSGAAALAATAAGACAPGGPLAAVCAIVVGAASWLAVDHALVAVDEARHRSGMRADLLDALDAARREWADDLKRQQRAVVDHLATEVGASIDRVFVPVRHGW